MEPAAFLAHCKARNVLIETCQGTTITLFKKFTPGSKEQYTEAESDVSVLYETKSVGPGSVWGTDGGSIGGMVGMQGGYMRLHKSGVGKKYVQELRKLWIADMSAHCVDIYKNRN